MYHFYSKRVWTRCVMKIWVTKSRKKLQHARVLRRAGFDKRKLDTIVRWQGGGMRKENLADHVLNTGMSKARLVRLLQKWL
jgi:dephospho-CoA kinase